MILFSHPLGNANARQAALALEEAGLLAELWTCLHWTPGQPAERWLPAGVARELGRRSFPAPVRPKLRTAPWREALRLLAGRLPGGGALTRHETGPASVDAVFRGLDRAVARRLPALARRGGLRGVYAYEDGAAATFRAAGALGLTRFYDLPIGYWRAGRAIFDEEAAREPRWAPTLTGLADSPAKLARKDEELAGADAVVVASSFTRGTLDRAPGLRAPVHVVPYGAPAPAAGAAAAADRAGSAPLRVLFAGSLGQRKGISYLLEAVRRLGPRVELTLLGGKTAAGCPPLEEAVRAHRWLPSLTHAGVLAEMSRQDVLVFPSLFEGFGLVIPEALSRGLPVITTPHTAGPDLLADGVDGFVVPIRSPEAIADRLEILFDPARRREMRHAALRKATLLSWEAYRRGLAACLAETFAASAAPVASILPV